jgi:hypothetical protein
MIMARIALLLPLVAGLLQPAHHASRSGCKWQPTNISSVGGNLQAIKAFAPDDAWAAGRESQGDGRLKAFRWNGLQWTGISEPEAAANVEFEWVNRIDGSADGDLWFAGAVVIDDLIQPKIWHYDYVGSRWIDYALPSLPSGWEGQIFNILEIGSRDVWALGEEEPNLTNNRTQYVLHWNGSTWSMTLLPSQTVDGYAITGGVVRGFTGKSDGDLWAAGDAYGDQMPVVEHYDGSNWIAYSVNPRPGQIPPNANFDAIFEVGPDDIWATGKIYYFGKSSFWIGTFADHWDGSNWTWVPTPSYNPGGKGQDNELVDVSGSSANNIWAVGFEQGSYTNSHALAEFWNGSKWSVPEGPYSLPAGSLDSVSVIGLDEVWAAEDYLPKQPGEEALYYCPM